MESLLQIEISDQAIAHIALNQPATLNALSLEMMQELQQVIHRFGQDKAIKAILLTGIGKGFCAGANIKQLAALDAHTGLAFARLGQQVFTELEQCGKPVLAAIHGFAFGGGCELAMAATMRIASATTLFGQPEIKLGVMPGFGGTQRLARLIGKGRAIDLCLSGRSITAAEALTWGLISEVLPEANLFIRAKEILTSLIQLPPIALQNIIVAINDGYDLHLDKALELEAKHFAACCATQDKDEGVQAFLAKRPAIFQGH